MREPTLAEVREAIAENKRRAWRTFFWCMLAGVALSFIRCEADDGEMTPQEQSAAELAEIRDTLRQETPWCGCFFTEANDYPGLNNDRWDCWVDLGKSDGALQICTSHDPEDELWCRSSEFEKQSWLWSSGADSAASARSCGEWRAELDTGEPCGCWDTPPYL